MVGKTIVANVIHHGISLMIEYEKNPVNHRDTWRPCGDGVWLYDTKDKELCRNSIGFCHELPYHYEKENWNISGRFHLVVASSKPLWVWWGEGCDKLKFGDIGVALPEINKK